MNTHCKNNQPQEVIDAMKNGFTIQYVFNEGFLCLQSDGEPKPQYAIKDVFKIPVPSIETRQIVYRIKTPDNSWGYVIVDIEEDF